MKKYLLLLAVTVHIFAACTKEEIDDQRPSIDLSIPGAFPQNCDTLWLGETFSFRALFTDNRALGSFSIEIHENFDHHAHSTEVTECELNPVKQPVNPFLFIQNFEIPEGLAEYEANVEILIPSGNSAGVFDEGDYHLFISLTDREGWSAQKGLSVKMMNR
jgi:hypothetical protein